MEREFDNKGDLQDGVVVGPSSFNRAKLCLCEFIPGDYTRLILQHIYLSDHLISFLSTQCLVYIVDTTTLG